ncbi:uncharacterized protein LOC133181655 isoform X2 [Saccostrea echinata]|uniref:uncharacterized protein LOC133181655 isoform X2 n=1 Tax=Saccostrea echinata TaxID=191078 RepID=UPI002A81864A|nr:uncharacterized protein LOC133181655 isoform X2 [Saccostrea echinata]
MGLREGQTLLKSQQEQCIKHVVRVHVSATSAVLVHRQCYPGYWPQTLKLPVALQLQLREPQSLSQWSLIHVKLWRIRMALKEVNMRNKAVESRSTQV